MRSDLNSVVLDPVQSRLHRARFSIGQSRPIRVLTCWLCAIAFSLALGSTKSLGANLVLTWNDNSSNESGFKIERSSANSAFAQIAVTGADVATYTDTGLAQGTQFAYRVRAYNGTGDSAYTNAVSATTVAASNAAPTIGDVASVSISANTSTGTLAFAVGDLETAAGSLAVTASSSNLTLVPAGNIVLGGSGANRTVSVTPASNQSGTATITLTVSDGSMTATDTFSVTVSVQNTAPTIGDIANRSVNASVTTGAIDFTVGDAQTNAGSLLVTANSSNLFLVPEANLSLRGSGANRSLNVTPAFGQTGIATITVTVSDGSLSVSGSFVLTVNVVNTAPTIADISNRSVDANTSTGAISFAIGDAQTSASLLSVTANSTNLTLVPSSNIVLGGNGSTRTVAISPASNQSGTATITLTVSDGVLTASDSFVLTVNAVNTPPTISDISNRTIDANTATAALPFVVGDTQTAADALAISGASSNSTLVPSSSIVFGGSGANRTVMIVPAANQAGTATITVTVNDGLATASDTFTIVVNAINTAPSITPIASRTIDANTGTGALGFTIGDAETSAANLSVLGSSSNTVLVPNANIVVSGSGANRSVTVTPAANQTGVAIVTLTVSDGSLTASATFTLTVNAVATAPTISPIANSTIAVNGTTGAMAFTIGHATLPAGSLTVTATSSNATLAPQSSLVLEGTDANRRIAIAPVADKTGTATITIVVSDGTLSTSASFLLTVNAVNTAPTISSIPEKVINSNGSTGAISFTVGDSATAAGSLLVTANSSNLTLVPMANISLGGSGASRTVLVTPAANQSGSTTITLTVSDGLLSSSTTFQLNVRAANTPPTIADLPNRSILKNTSTGAFSVFVADQDTATSSLVLSAHSSNLALLPLASVALGGTDGNRSVVLTPVANQTGTATVTLTVSDGATSASTSFVLTVGSSNTPPSITSIANQAANAGRASRPIGFTVADAETDAGSLLVTATSSNLSLVPNAAIQLGGAAGSRTLILTPVAGQTGTATITVTVNDGSATESSSFVVTVIADTAAPTIGSVANRTIAMNGSTGPIAFNVGDARVAASALTLSGNSSNLALVPVSAIVFGGSAANRTVTISPASNQTGSSTLTLSVSNGTLVTSTSFVVTVTAPNTAPTITPIANRTLETNFASGAIDFIVADAQTPSGSLTVTGSSSNPGLIPQEALSFSGIDSTRALSLTPLAGKTGTTTITITVSDGALSATSTFVVTVTPKNSAPTITAIGPRSIFSSTISAAIDFFISDALTPAGDLTLAVTSSNAALAPQSGIAFGGSGANRWLSVTPAGVQTGTSTLTVTVSDGTLSASTSFVLSVNVPNTSPTISAPANRSTVANRNSGAIDFTVDDAETAVGSLSVTGTSSNPSLLPVGNIVFGGSGENRTVTLTPAANLTGTVTVTLTVSDGSLATSTNVVLTITAQSTAPKISDIQNRTIAVNGNTAVAFTVSDGETAAGSLTVTAVSQNTVLVPEANILFGGSGANRTALITPATDRNGTAVITFKVSDGALSSTSNFAVTVNAAGTAPTISRIFNRSIDANSSTGPIAFLVSDADTPIGNVVVTGTSSNPTLIPNASIVFGGSGNNRTVTISPAANQAGNALVTVSANDGKTTTSYSFYITVLAVNVAPTISDLPNRSIAANGMPELIGFTVADADTAVSSLSLSATSSNQALLPNSAISFAGTGTSRTMSVSPVANQVGIASVTVTVSDGNLSASDSFVLTVGAIVDDGSQAPVKPSEPNPGQPVLTDIVITKQPQDQSIVTGTSTTLSVEVVNSNAFFYQWYAGARGDVNTPVDGASTSVLTTPSLAVTTTYWVRIWSSARSASSQAAVVTVRSDNRYFFGVVGAAGINTGAVGTQASTGAFGLLIRANNTGLFLADSPSLAQGVMVNFIVAQNGSFTFDAPGVGIVSGFVSGTSVSGMLGGTGLAFTGTQEASNGSTSGVAGIYNGALINSSNSEVIALAGSSGRAFVALSQDGIFRGREAVLSADGVIAATLADGSTLGLDTDAGRLHGTVTIGSRSLDVGGNREDVSSATKVNNMSVRAHAGAGSESLIAGFSIGGAGNKQVIVRAVGPGLTQFGVAGALADPIVTVRRQVSGDSVLVGENDNWVEADAAQIFQTVGAFPLPAGSKDAALILSLPAGGYTAQIASADGSAGAALVEIYDGDRGSVPGAAKLTNISLRGNAGMGDQVIVTGFNVAGDAPRRMLIRAVGSELGAFGVAGALNDPQLTIFKSVDGKSTEVAFNNDWGTNGEVVTTLSSQVGAFGLTAGSKSSAIVAWLAPGTYTAHAKSTDGSTGIVIVEVYEAP